MAITAPYNFVPLSQEVFFPDWGDQVSHDIPFEDGISGEIVCELITQTPVYVRNGGNWSREDILLNREAQSFFNVNGQVIIPGTSLKGMLRNVIEIATFGKMCRVDDHRYSVRDLSNSDKTLYADWMTETVHSNPPPAIYKSKVGSGWLSLAGDGTWAIKPCHYARVDQVDLLDYRRVQKLPFVDIKRKQSSLKKYSGWGRKSLTIKFDPVANDYNHSCGKLRYVKAENLGAGGTSGILVFTGQPSDNAVQVPLSPLPDATIQQIKTVAPRFILCKPRGQQYNLICKGVMDDAQRDRLVSISFDTGFHNAISRLYDASWKKNKPKTKHMEFLFFDKVGENLKTITVPREKKLEFVFIHSDNSGKPNEEWGDSSKRLEKGSDIPVFFRLDEDNNLHSIGLTQMYKLPYAYRTRDVVKNTSYHHFDDHRPDFAETLFGYVSETQKGRILKGRVAFSHALGNKLRHYDQPFLTVLGTPKPTYYPSYLEQPEPAKRYRTYMDPNPNQPENERVIPHVRGWKRYPVRREEAVVTPPQPPPNVTKDAKTAFIPLHSGASFEFSVKVHNLKPAELGALLWALEWGGNKNLCHSLGMGKAFGYGVVRISVDQSKTRLKQIAAPSNSTHNIMQSYIASNSLPAFIDCMKNGVATDWSETPQLVQLLAMANPMTHDIQTQKTKLKQMNVLGDNEFVAGKGNPRQQLPAQALQPYVPFSGISDKDRFKRSPEQYDGTKGLSVEMTLKPQPVMVPSDADMALLLSKFGKKTGQKEKDKQ